MPRLEAIKRPKLTDVVTEKLMAAILKGEFVCGEKLPTERVLGERLGVSRNVVREAINELRVRGLVETRQGAGSVVTGQVHKPVRDVMQDMLGISENAETKLLEFRQVIEVQVAALAARRATDEDIAEMETLLQQFHEAAPDLARCAELDIAFHHAVCKASGNELFGLVVEPICELLAKTREQALKRSGLDYASTSHGKLLDAISDHDPEQAAAVMNEHLEVTMELRRRSQES